MTEDTGNQIEKPSEKRRYRRFQNQSLMIEVARPGIKGIIKANPSADCLNFSRTGLQFDCPQKLQQGEPLLVDISVDDVVLRDLRATVVSQQTGKGANSCYGIRFTLENPNMKKDEVHRKLLLIEDRLKSSTDYPYSQTSA